jgi:hypothetical protein
MTEIARSRIPCRSPPLASAPERRQCFHGVVRKEGGGDVSSFFGGWRVTAGEALVDGNEATSHVISVHCLVAPSGTNTGQGHAVLELVSTGYGTVTGELLSAVPAPRQRTPHIPRPAQHHRQPGVTFTVTLTGGQIPLGRPIPRGGLLQHVRVKRGLGSARMKKSCVIPPCYC